MYDWNELVSLWCINAECDIITATWTEIFVTVPGNCRACAATLQADSVCLYSYKYKVHRKTMLLLTSHTALFYQLKEKKYCLVKLALSLKLLKVSLSCSLKWWLARQPTVSLTVCHCKHGLPYDWFWSQTNRFSWLLHSREDWGLIIAWQLFFLRESWHSAACWSCEVKPRLNILHYPLWRSCRDSQRKCSWQFCL